MATKKDQDKIGRDAGTGRYVPLSETVKRPKETVVEPRGKPPAAKPKRK